MMMHDNRRQAAEWILDELSKDPSLVNDLTPKYVSDLLDDLEIDRTSTYSLFEKRMEEHSRAKRERAEYAPVVLGEFDNVAPTLNETAHVSDEYFKKVWTIDSHSKDELARPIQDGIDILFSQVSKNEYQCKLVTYYQTVKAFDIIAAEFNKSSPKNLERLGIYMFLVLEDTLSIQLISLAEVIDNVVATDTFNLPRLEETYSLTKRKGCEKHSYWGQALKIPIVEILSNPVMPKKRRFTTWKPLGTDVCKKEDFREAFSQLVKRHAFQTCTLSALTSSKNNVTLFMCKTSGNRHSMIDNESSRIASYEVELSAPLYRDELLKRG